VSGSSKSRTSLKRRTQAAAVQLSQHAVAGQFTQRGVVHTYLYDSAGRLAHDCVTDLGASGIVDDAILRISTTYDDLGRVRSVTGYDDPQPASKPQPAEAWQIRRIPQFLTAHRLLGQ